MVLGNTPELWEVMLASMKLGTVLIPATTAASAEELADRVHRGRVKCIITSPDQVSKFSELPLSDRLKICIEKHAGWHFYADARFSEADFLPEHTTQPNDPMLLYFTSGTTAKPKLVLHTHRSYPVGSLSTMYWLGLQPEDIHVNVSSPGWAKHAWSSFFAPWNAGATVLMVSQSRFDARTLLTELTRCAATTFCAPPTVWRLMLQHELADHPVKLREICSAGEPLNPEVIERVKRKWGLTIRDGFGQTETTAVIANSPGQIVKPGAMGRVLPGYRVELVNADGENASEGELQVSLQPDVPAGLMAGYEDNDELTPISGKHFRTSDVALKDSEGYLTFVGRVDDVFKSSDYRISPFELESVLIEQETILEAAVVPRPDLVRHAVPKAYVILKSGQEPSRDVALAIFQKANSRLSPFKRIRVIEFVAELPKTISGKIKRAELRRVEAERALVHSAAGQQFFESDFEELKPDRPHDAAHNRNT